MSRPVLPESAYAALGLSPDTIKFLMTPKPDPPKIAAPNLLQSDEDSARPMALNETSITLYAELLLHIRTITLFASLRTNHTRETQAKLSADGSCITVSHEGHSASIHLPINANTGGDAALSLPSQPPGKELTLRMQLEEQEGSNLLITLQGEERKANLVPWDGASLNQHHDLEAICKNCRAVILPKEKITEWRDLPNENWAEMMDFWHCHKPDEHHLHDHTHEEIVGQKGYAAGNRLQAVDSVGFVDLTSFLLKEQDCEGAKLSSGRGLQQGSIVCQNCEVDLGFQDDASNGWWIRKWSLGIISSPSGTPTIFTIQKWISARLIYLIENSGLRKFHIHPPPPSTIPSPISDHSSQTSESQEPTPSLLIWVFTPDMLFSSSISSPNRHDPTRSIKIFYQEQTWQPLKPGDAESATIEDVEFPEELYEGLEKALSESQRLLPATTRTFQGWNVSLLERFDVGDVWKSAGANGQDAPNAEGDNELNS